MAHGHTGCVKIYGEDMEAVVRVETCRAWCPLLRQVIAGALLLLALTGCAPIDPACLLDNPPASCMRGTP